MAVLIGGGTGLVGRELIKYFLNEGYEVRILSRRHQQIKNVAVFKWDVETMQIDHSAFEGVTHVINLAGAGIADKRWTKDRKKLIIESRVKTTQLLAKGIRDYGHSVKHFISASAIGFYGDRANEPLTEASEKGQGFLSESTVLWEKAVHQLKSDLQIAITIFRLGIVLSKKGGALEKMLFPLNFGVSGYFGDGKQWYSWIHYKDVSRAIYSCVISDSSRNETYNLVAPNPVTNKQFAKTLSKVNSSFSVALPVPSFLLKIGLGEMSHVVLDSTKVDSTKIQKELSFTFNYAHLESALLDILS